MTLISMKPCSVRFKFQQSELRSNAVKEKLKKIKAEREDMQRNILQYFTAEDPYYKAYLDEEDEYFRERERFSGVMQ